MQLKLGDQVIAEIPDDDARALIDLAANPGRLMQRIELTPLRPEERVVGLQNSYLQERFAEMRCEATIKITFTYETPRRLEENQDLRRALGAAR